MKHLRRGVGGAIALAVALLVTAALAPPSGALTSDQQLLLDKTNQLRAGSGLPPLQIDPEAQALADQWAAHMASIGQLVHPEDQYAGISTPVYRVGDDITQAFDAANAFELFKNSQVHRDNILDARYDLIGIGIASASDGTIYVQLKFIGSMAMLPPPEEPAPEPVAPAPPPAAVEEPTTEEVAVLSETLTQNVNLAVIPPVHYGALGFPPAETSNDSSSSILPAIAIGLGVGLVVVSAVLGSHFVRRRRTT